MYLLEIDRALNRLHLTLMRTIDEEQAESFFRMLERRLGELQEGFHIVTDLTKLKALEREATPYIRRAMDLCNGLGVGRIIRIIPEPSKSFGFTVMSYFHYDRSVPIVTCANLEEAVERFL
jgi:hypothetical protein